jgi:hypothetical protein
MTPGLGRLPSSDPRNRAHPMARALAEPPRALPVPDVRTWGFYGSVLDQRSTSTCTGHAGSHFIHCEPLAHRGFLNPFALYREAVARDEYHENDREATELDDDKLVTGSSGTGVAKALRDRGLIEGAFLWASEMRDALLWVLTRGPVMVGSNWYSSFGEPTPEGFIKITSSARVIGGHEYLIRGVDMPRGVALAVNSWGPDWNSRSEGRWGKQPLKDGHFLIDHGTLDRLFDEEGDGVSALEKRPAEAA